ncbi:MAG: signal transduction histidine kinase, partial [Deltaproteobacteria bacterium]|nr:signal transduction histidine kinase [Deltaproteobacteria bacterium]
MASARFQPRVATGGAGERLRKDLYEVCTTSVPWGRDVMGNAIDNATTSSNYAKRVLRRLSTARGPELEQGVIRLVLCLAAVVWLHLQYVVLPVRLIALAYIVFSILVLITILLYPGANTFRRMLAMTLDMLVPCYCMYFTDRNGSPLILILFWDMFGYTFRYGKRYLIYGIFLSVAGFGYVVASTPYWIANRELGITLLLGLTVMPAVFVGIMVKKVQDAMSKAEVANRA